MDETRPWDRVLEEGPPYCMRSRRSMGRSVALSLFVVSAVLVVGCEAPKTQITKIRAPISGRLSRRLIDPGNLVNADETILTSIVSLDPMYVYFDIDERTLLKIRRLIREGRVRTRQEAEVVVLVGLSDEEGFP